MEGVSLPPAARTQASSSWSPPNLLVLKTLPGALLLSSTPLPQGHYKAACSARSLLNVCPQARMSLGSLSLCQKATANQGWI